MKECPKFKTDAKPNFDEFQLPEKAPFQGKKEDYDATRRQKALCLRLALWIVERLSMTDVTEDLIEKSLPWLEREQFDDISIERNADKICGYPLCNEHLPQQKRQQFRISLRNKCVYDVTERRKFCSDWCYTASVHLRQQISPEPAWCRQHFHANLNQKSFHFLSKKKIGIPGEIILDARDCFAINDDEVEIDRDDDSSSTCSESVCDNGVTKSVAKLVQTLFDDSASSSSDSESDHEPEKLNKKDDLLKQNLEEDLSEMFGQKLKIPSDLKIEEHSVSEPKKSSLRKSKFGAKKTVRIEQQAGPTIDCKFKNWLSLQSASVIMNQKKKKVNKHYEYQEKVIKSFFTADPDLNISKDHINLPSIDNVSQNFMRMKIFREIIMPHIKSEIVRREFNERDFFNFINKLLSTFNLTKENVEIDVKEASFVAKVLSQLFQPEEVAKENETILNFTETIYNHCEDLLILESTRVKESLDLALAEVESLKLNSFDDVD